MTLDTINSRLKTLAEVPCWHLWCEVQKRRADGTPYKNKTPFQAPAWARKRGPGSKEGATTLAAARPALAALRAACKPGTKSGLGLATDLCGAVSWIDLDGCLNPDGGMRPWAQPIIEAADRAGLYVERSPGGQGLRIGGSSVMSEMPAQNRVRWRPVGVVSAPGEKAQGIDLFHGSIAYVTITGKDARGSVDADVSPLLDMLLREASAQVGNRVRASGQGGKGKTPVQGRGALLSIEGLRKLLEAVPCDGGALGDNDHAVRVYSALAFVLGAAWEEAVPHVLDWGMGYDGDDVWLDTTLRNITENGVTHTHEGGFLDWARKHGAPAEVIEEVEGNVAAQDFAGIEPSEDRGVPPADAPPRERTHRDTMFGQWAWIDGVSMFYDTGTRVKKSIEDWRKQMVGVAPIGARGGNAADAIYFNAPLRARILQGVTVLPGGPAIIKMAVDGVRGLYANNWRPSLMKPKMGATRAEAQFWIDHLMLVYEGREDVVRRVVGRFAHIIQKPGVKINSMLLTIGPQGVGKDAAVAPIKEGLGMHNVSQITTGDMGDGKFNEFLASTLVIVTEMKNTERFDLEERMKPWLAAPPETLHINPKYGKQYTAPNLVNWIGFSNHDDAVKLRNGDRRHEVYKSNAEVPPPSHFDTYFARAKNGGNEAVVGWLASLDLTAGEFAFSPYAPLPETEDMREVVEATLTSVALRVKRMFEVGGMFHGRTVITGDEVKAVVEIGQGVRDGDHGPRVDKQIAIGLREAGGVSLRNMKVVGPGKRREYPWVMKREKVGLLSSAGSGAVQNTLEREQAQTKAWKRSQPEEDIG